MNKNLGRGLSAFLDVESFTNTTDKIVMLELEKIDMNPYQPRKVFNDEELNELALSIQAKGVLQPIIVRLVNNRYQLIAGERRLRASKLATKSTIPAIVITASDNESAEFALLENLQRENLTVIEEADAYHRLILNFGHTQEKLAKSLGKSRSHIANILRLNGLSEKIKNYINNQAISFGHAKILMGQENADDIVDYIIEHHLSVRQTEKYIQSINIEKNISHAIENIVDHEIHGDVRNNNSFSSSIDMQSFDKINTNNLTQHFEINNHLQNDVPQTSYNKKENDVENHCLSEETSFLSTQKSMINETSFDKNNNINYDVNNENDLSFMRNSFVKKNPDDEKTLIQQKNSRQSQSNESDSELQLIEHRISSSLGLPVKLKVFKDGGSLEIKFDSISELDGLMQKFSLLD